MVRQLLKPTCFEFVRFLVAGVINTAVGYIAFMLLWAKWFWSPEMANLVSYAVGLCVAFSLNHLFVFKTGKCITHVTATRFLLAFAVAYGLNLGALKLLIGMNMDPQFAQIGAMAVYTLTFYVLNKRLVWR